MSDDTDQLLEAVTDAIPKLLATMEAFEQLQGGGRYAQGSESIKPFAEQLSVAMDRFAGVEFPEDLQPFGERIHKSIEYSLRACENMARHSEGIGKVMQAMRAHCRAQELIYPLSAFMTPVSRYFVEPDARANTSLIQRLGEGADRERVGIHSASNDRDSRGGFSLYIPEYLDETKPASLVIALHGGTGHGADFLWSWLREARTRGFLVMTPTSQLDTWSFDGEEHDLPTLLAMLDFVKSQWPIDEQHILLTGMSDGATYSLLAGLNANSPFTHLAPFSGVLHPDLVMSGRIRYAEGRPIYLVHGTLDWMFPIEVAYMAREELDRAGAQLTFREIEGLSHAYARSENPALIEWFNPTLSADR